MQEQNSRMASRHTDLWLNPTRVNFRHRCCLGCSAQRPTKLHPNGSAENTICRPSRSRVTFRPLLRHHARVHFLAKILPLIQRSVLLHHLCFPHSQFCSPQAGRSSNRWFRFVHSHRRHESLHLFDGIPSRAFVSYLPIPQQHPDSNSTESDSTHREKTRHNIPGSIRRNILPSTNYTSRADLRKEFRKSRGHTSKAMGHNTRGRRPRSRTKRRMDSNIESRCGNACGRNHHRRLHNHCVRVRYRHLRPFCRHFGRSTDPQHPPARLRVGCNNPSKAG
jgi:hypothetical protein